jgi:hypothetical protein
MKEKTDEELREEFFARGGEIEVIPYIEPEVKSTIGSITKKVPVLKTLPEAELLYGKKQVKRRKAKKPDYSNINMELIPEHLKKLLGVDKTETTKEEKVEANKNLGCTETGSES